MHIKSQTIKISLIFIFFDAISIHWGHRPIFCSFSLLISPSLSLSLWLSQDMFRYHVISRLYLIMLSVQRCVECTIFRYNSILLAEFLRAYKVLAHYRESLLHTKKHVDHFATTTHSITFNWWYARFRAYNERTTGVNNFGRFSTMEKAINKGFFFPFVLLSKNILLHLYYGIIIFDINQ